MLLIGLFCIKGLQLKSLENFQVISYKLVAPGYEYSPNTIKWRGMYFMPYLCEEYKNDSLLNVGIYKSEGLLMFTSSEMEQDRLLKEEFSIKTRREVFVGKEIIFDSGKKYEATNYRHRYYCQFGKHLKVYIPALKK